MANKRDFLRMLLVAGLLGVATPAALADDDSGGGSEGGGGSGSGGSGGSSGSSGGSDDGGSDDHDDDSSNDGGSGDHSGSSSGSGSSGNDSSEDDSDSEQERARKAVERGDAVSLKRVLANVNRQYNGRVVSVSLRGSKANLSYNIRIIDNQNRLLNLVVNARTGQITSTN